MGNKNLYYWSQVYTSKEIKSINKKLLIENNTIPEVINYLPEIIKAGQELTPFFKQFKQLAAHQGADGLNIFEQTGGFDKKQTETIFRPFSK